MTDEFRRQIREYEEAGVPDQVDAPEAFNSMLLTMDQMLTALAQAEAALRQVAMFNAWLPNDDDDAVIRWDHLRNEVLAVLAAAPSSPAAEQQPARGAYTFHATCGICGTGIGGDGDVCNRCAQLSWPEQVQLRDSRQPPAPDAARDGGGGGA